MMRLLHLAFCGAICASLVAADLLIVSTPQNDLYELLAASPGLINTSVKRFATVDSALGASIIGETYTLIIMNSAESDRVFSTQQSCIHLCCIEHHSSPRNLR